MLAARRLDRSGCTIISGSRTRKVAPLSLAAARRLHGAAVQLDDVAHDREPEPEPAGLARRRRIGLAEPLEDVRQEIRRDADRRCR